jgi:hypothetical protein
MKHVKINKALIKSFYPCLDGLENFNKDYYGLEAPMCSCGKNRFTCSTGVTKTKSEYDDWIKTLSVDL